MKKWQYISLWVAGSITFLLLISWSQGRYHQLRISSVELEFKNRQEKSFLDPSEIYQIIDAEYGEIKGLLMLEINKSLLEESIEYHPTIAKAEVYSDLDGRLWIMLWQHEPLARVMNENGSHYLLEDGLKMPLSQHYSEAVPLVSGALTPERAMEIADFFEGLKRDAFFTKAFSALACDEDGNWILYPEKGDFKIRMGEPKNLDKKLRKLRVFYEQAPINEDIKTIREIDLRFDGQLICRKR